MPQPIIFSLLPGFFLPSAALPMQADEKAMTSILRERDDIYFSTFLLISLMPLADYVARYLRRCFSPLAKHGRAGITLLRVLFISRHTNIDSVFVYLIYRKCPLRYPPSRDDVPVRHCAPLTIAPRLGKVFTR